MCPRCRSVWAPTVDRCSCPPDAGQLTVITPQPRSSSGSGQVIPPLPQLTVTLTGNYAAGLMPAETHG